MTFIRSIGRWAMTGLVINGIIGSGIFGVPGELTYLPWHSLALVYQSRHYDAWGQLIDIVVLAQQHTAASASPASTASPRPSDTPSSRMLPSRQRMPL
jgi:hypothetical protein